MSSETQKILTSDGIPLEVSLKKAERKNKIKAFLLVAPLLLFLLITYVFPIGDMLMRSVDDKMVTNMLPKTFKSMESWDGKELPPEEVFEAFYLDYKLLIEKKTFGKLSTQLNYTKNGFKTILKKLQRKMKKFEEGNYKEQIMAVHPRWENVEYWRAIKRRAPAYTNSKYLKGIDMYKNEDGKIVNVPEDRQIHRILWLRTLEVAFFVTLLCFLMAYPIAHLLATLPMKYSNLLMICVLLPFWTSLLVRTVAWMVMLQQKGVFNNLLVMSHIISDENRFALMYNETATIIVMTQILLPFMVLPLYSVMKTISPNYMRAALNLGASPLHAFWKIYMPNSVPGISAGCMLVFILAIGYYITPELVGGKDGQMIGNWIAYHLKTTLNWGLCAALGAILLGVLTVLYWVYNKLVGIENIKLG